MKSLARALNRACSAGVIRICLSPSVSSNNPNAKRHRSGSYTQPRMSRSQPAPESARDPIVVNKTISSSALISDHCAQTVGVISTAANQIACCQRCLVAKTIR